MSNPASDGIHLTKKYYNDFMPTDLQWNVSEVDDNFTLYDLFKLIYHANMMISNISSTMGMLNFEEFWDQINLDRDSDDQDDLKYLELYWSPGYDTRKIKQTGKLTDQKRGNCQIMNDGYNYWDDPKICKMPNLMSFDGVGPLCPLKHSCSHECGDDCQKEDSGWAIEFTPLNNLAHLPIRVSPKVKFFPPYVESDREFHSTGFQLTIQPTLWCFIASILWELTFVGFSPDEIANKSKEILENIDKAKKHFKKNFDEEDNNILDINQ